jgi:integrase
MKPRKYMLPEEAKKLIESCESYCKDDLRHHRRRNVIVWMVIDLALKTGLRVGEIAKIKIKDIDFTYRAILVWRTKRKKHIQEYISMDDGLLSHIKQFIQWKQQVGESTEGEQFLLRSQVGEYTTAGLQHAWFTATKRVGLKDFSIHSARHTLAVRLLKQTNNLRIVQKQLGHTSIATTANTYADVTFEDMGKALNSINWDKP